jgi:hypothetical protein
MNRHERDMIDALFAKLKDADRLGGARDPEAEFHIAGHVGRQPQSPYYMVQAILVQEQALAAAQQRIEELERDLRSRPAAGGGFLGGLFGTPKAVPSHGARHSGGPWGGGHASHHRAPFHTQGHGHGPWGRPSGGSFLGGAMQTAMAVAGGIVAGNLIADLLTPDAAQAADLPNDAGYEPAAEEGGAEDAGAWDQGADFGGDEI